MIRQTPVIQPRLSGRRWHRAFSVLPLVVVGSIAGCGPAADAASETETASPEEPMNQMAMVPTQIVELLASGQAVFGIFSGDHTPEQGAVMATNRETDFVFYSLESGPFDIPAMEGYMEGLASGVDAAAVHPIALRIPPIGDDPAGARSRIQEGVEAGVAAIVVPHVENADQAVLAVEAIGSDGWPTNPEGQRTNILIIEDKEAIPNARAIASTPGVGVVIPGPGDLRRSFEGDMDAVEGAIQEVLAICLELDVACGITAGPDDISTRLEQGFRMIIVTSPDALAVGRAAAGRSE